MTRVERLARAEALALAYAGPVERSARLRTSCFARDFAGDTPESEDLRVAGWLLGLPPDGLAECAPAVGALVAAVAAGSPTIHQTPGAVLLVLCRRLVELDDRPAQPDADYARFREALRDPTDAQAAPLWDVLDAMHRWPCPSDDPEAHPAWREFRRRMAEQPTPGNGSRMALDELDQIGAWAGRWIADHAPPHVRAHAIATLEAACPDGGRAYWDKEATALRSIRALMGETR